MHEPKMQFILKGFNQIEECRIFDFERIASDWTRTPFSVRTDVSLTRHYGIRLQELPLLCRAVLERRPEGEEQRAFTFAEEDMRLYAEAAAAREEATKQRKPSRRSASSCVGSAWRVPPR